MTEAGRNTAAALILLFALIFAILVALIVPAFLSWTENGRIIRENRERIAAIRASQTAFVRVKNANDRWTLFAHSPEAGFLDADTPAEAMEVARDHIAALVLTHSGTMDAIELVPGETKRSQVETVLIDLTAILPKASLATFLADLEDTPPYVFISAFRARAEGEDTVTLLLKGQMQSLAEVPL